MKIDVIKDIDTETQDVYSFILFDLTAVFVNYHRQVKPIKKRTWQIISFWDKYGRNSTIEEPVLPKDIKYQALYKIKELIKINTWKEYKAE